MRTPLSDLFLGFLGIGAMSFGGGLAAWIRRETVQRRGWLDDRQFLAGYALSQIVPGATNVNLAVFIGAQLRGLSGAAVAVIGLLAVPVGFVMAAGALYSAARGGPTAALIARALAGMGAAAIGLNLATGIRLGVSNLRAPGAVLVAAITAAAVGLLDVPLLYALGSHKGSGFSPMEYKSETAEDVWFCGCKRSGGKPCCDGTHETV